MAEDEQGEEFSAGDDAGSGEPPRPERVSRRSFPGRPGRPTKLTAEVYMAILDRVRLGMPIEQAVRSYVSPKTFYNWQNKAKAGKEPYKTLWSGEYEAVCAERHHELLRLLKLVTLNQKATLGSGDNKREATINLNALIFQLERLERRTWAPRHELTGADGGPVSTGAAVIILPAEDALPTEPVEPTEIEDDDEEDDDAEPEEE